MEDYGLALKKLRQHFALTQRELGERVGISNHAISKWEHGVNQPDISSLRAICEVFGITTEDFFRIAAGEEVADVLNRTENSPIESEMAGGRYAFTAKHRGFIECGNAAPYPHFYRAQACPCYSLRRACRCHRRLGCLCRCVWAYQKRLAE